MERVGSYLVRSNVTGKKRSAVFVISVCNSFAVLKFRAAGDVEENGQEKPRSCSLIIER